jgi:hypothetical protein
LTAALRCIFCLQILIFWFVKNNPLIQK